jgi:hypothetical protein
MDKFSWKCLLFLLLGSFSNISSSTSSITIEEITTGILDVHIVISSKDLIKSKPIKNGKSYGFTLLLIPFEHSKEWKVSNPQDVIVSNISTFKGYSLVSVIFPTTKNNDLKISIQNAAKLSENREGKAKIILDMNYPYLSGAVKDLTELDFVFDEWDFTFNLLKKYENDEVSKSHNSINRSGDKAFQIKQIDIDSLSNKEVWLVFPNARQRAFDTGKLVISLLVGVLTIFFQFSSIRERKLSMVSAIFLISGFIVGISFYYAHYLAKGFELAVWGAALIPHVIMSFFGAIYVLIAKSKQAIISIPIQKDGVPIEFGVVALLGKRGNDWIQIEKLEKLLNGNGYFHLWIKSRYSAYKIKAKTTGTQTVESREFTPSPKDKIQLDLINLVTPPPP